MKIAEARLPKTDTPIIPANSEPHFTLLFTKSEADVLVSCLDVTVKATGVQAIQAVALWLDKIKDAMKP